MASKEISLDVNKFPSLTWNFLDINKARFENKFSSELGYSVKGASDFVNISEIKLNEVKNLFSEIETGLGKDFDSVFDSYYESENFSSTLFTVKENERAPHIKIEIDSKNDDYAIKDFVIHAEKNSVSSFVFSSKSDDSVNGLIGLRIRIIADENSIVHISSVNMNGKNLDYFVSLGSVVNDNASVDYTELELGGNKVYSGNYELLKSYKSSCISHTGYLVKSNTSLDMNYVAKHIGRDSTSTMNVDGVILEEGKKVWRGTIDFVRGCIDSKGEEQENVLLLDPNLVNKSLPVILCDEEAVEGHHGASIGKLSNEILFYMESKGIDKVSAQKLAVKAKINAVSRFIPDEDLLSDIHDYIDGAFFDDYE